MSMLIGILYEMLNYNIFWEPWVVILLWYVKLRNNSVIPQKFINLIEMILTPLVVELYTVD